MNALPTGLPNRNALAARLQRACASMTGVRWRAAIADPRHQPLFEFDVCFDELERLVHELPSLGYAVAMCQATSRFLFIPRLTVVNGAPRFAAERTEQMSASS